MVVVFYVTGHGLGHASRTIEVIRALHHLDAGARVVVRTSAQPWIFELALGARVELQPFEADTGAAQRDSLRLDEDETARRAATFYAGFDAREAAEAQVLRGLHATVAVSDVPPLAFPAAARAGVPGLALGNFTWDWIYEAFPHFDRLAPGVLPAIRRAYAQAALALRLPLHGGFAPMQRVVRDIPLVARRARRDRADTRRALHCDDGRPVVLVSFGGYGLDLPYEALGADGRFLLVLTDQEAARAVASGSSIRHVAMRDLAARDIRYEDVVAAADVVVSKPGYGIVSECIANEAALLYTSRGRFIEQDMFVREMPRVLRCRYIDQEALRAGRWWDAIEALLAQPPPAERLPITGAAAAADAILSAGNGR